MATISKVQQFGTGAINRDITEKLVETVSVTDFGAVGDGVTDDTAAIQAALDSGAKAIHLPLGTYKTTGVTFFSNDQRVYGDGDGTVVTFAGPLGVVFNADGRTRCGIENLWVQCTAGVQDISQTYTQAGFRALTAVECFVRNCRFSGFAGGPVFMQDASKCEVTGNLFDTAQCMPLATNNFGTADITFWKQCTDNLIANNTSVSAASYHIILQTVVAAAQNSSRNRIVGNSTYNNKVYGILVYNIDSSVHTITETLIDGNLVDTVQGFYNNPASGNKDYGAGIYVLQAEHTIVSNNIVRNTNIDTNGSTLTPSAISLNAVSHGTVVGNCIYDAKWHSIWVSDTLQQGAGTSAGSVSFIPSGFCTIQDNNIYNSTKSAIIIKDKHQVLCSGNTIHKVTQASMTGIDVSGSVTNYTTPGMKNISVVGNSVVDVSSISINISNCLNAVVSANKCDIASNTGLFINSTGTNITGNTITACTVRGIDLRATGSSSVISGNYITTSGVGALCSHSVSWGSNSITANTTNYSGSYAPWTSATFNPSNLADGAGETTTVTATGAALGDFASATFSLDLQGITLTAWVSAADTVSVRFQNETGGALDLGSGTLRVKVTKQ